MSWLAHLDAKAASRSVLIRWPYRVLKWSLIAVGAYLAIGSAWVELSEKRVGIGSGIVVTVILATVKGLLTAGQRDA